MLRAPVILLLLSAAACAKPAPTQWERIGVPLVDGKPDLSRVEIRMERTECCDYCPAYQVTLRGDGEGMWNGTAYVRHMGEEALSFASDRLPALLGRLDQLGIARGEHACRWKSLTGSLTYLELRVGERVYRLCDCQCCDSDDPADPERLWHELAAETANEIDALAGSEWRVGSFEERRGNHPRLLPSTPK